MPAYLCKCKTRISVGEIPCNKQWNFISDVKFDNWHGKIDAEELYQEMEPFFKCPHCQRVAIFWNGWGNEPTFYKVEI